MAKGDHEETSRKLALLEGDRKAYLESSQAAVKLNAQKISELRKENKALITQLKSLKEPGLATQVSGPKAIQLLDTKASEHIKRHNALRHQAAAKMKRIEELDKLIRQLELEEGSSKSSGVDSQGLRDLENRLDKAVIKNQEAQFIGKTYKQIIERLQQDRLTFDGRVTALEQAIVGRRQEINRLEAMLSDASMARDLARADLSRAEQETVAARSGREQEKKRLQGLAEERRRHYEAMEKRLRLASVGEEKEEAGQALPEDVTQRLAALEAAFAKLQDAAGVTDPDDVLARYQGQSQTKEHLQHLCEQNTATQATLKTELEAAEQRLEAALYSGEEAAAGSKATLAASKERATAASARLASAKAEAEAAARLVAVVAAGVDSIGDKLHHRGEPATPHSDPLSARLSSAGSLLKALVAEIGSRQEELAAMHDEDLFAIVQLPANNARVPLTTAHKEAEDGSDSAEDEEATSRDAIKKQAASLVEAAKPKKKREVD